jgi:hypothetical protein
VFDIVAPECGRRDVVIARARLVDDYVVKFRRAQSPRPFE